MHSFIPTFLLAALASQASALPGPTHEYNGKGFAAKSGGFGTGIHSHHSHTGTGGYHPHTGTAGHHSHTGTADHHSATATLAARQFSEPHHSFTGSYPTSFPHHTGTGAPFPFPSGTGHFGAQGVAHKSGHAHHSGSFGGFGHPSGTGDFARPTGEAKFPLAVHAKSKTASDDTFPSLTVGAGEGIGGAATGTGGGAEPTGKGGKGGKHSKTRGSGEKTKTKHSKRQEPTGFPFPSGSKPTDPGHAHPSGFGGNHSFPSGSGGLAAPTGGFGGKQIKGYAHPSGSGFWGHSGYPAPTGGFHFPTGSGMPFPTTLRTSVVVPSAA